MTTTKTLANGVHNVTDAVDTIAQKMQITRQDESIETLLQPSRRPGKPYVISSQDGEIIYIPLSKSATRLLVTGEETEDAFAIVGSGGSQGDPIGFHYHHEAHDVFLCLQGNVNVWANDQCRTMSAGDFASVPPVCTICVVYKSHSVLSRNRAPYISTNFLVRTRKWLV